MSNPINGLRYVGWNSRSDAMFSPDIINLISNEITTRILHSDLRLNVIVPNLTIINVLSAVSDDGRRNIKSILLETIDIIVNDVLYNLTIEKRNYSQSVWTSVLGGHNTHGLMPHDKIKTQMQHKTVNNRGKVSFMNY